MARAGLTTTRVTEEAARIADEAGWEALTLQSVAQSVGVKVPSLYKHVESLGALRDAVSALSLGELADALTRAAVGQSGSGALHAVARAYRAYAAAHPGRYASTVPAAIGGSAERQRAAQRTLDVVQAALVGYGLGEEASIHAVRAVRSALHGFVALEAGGGFGMPLDVDASFDRLVEWLDLGLRSTAM